MGDMFDLTGRAAIVTGASSGLGVAFARALARHGADIVVAARRREALECTAEIVRGFGRRCLVVPTDLTDDAQVDTLFQRAIDEFGRLDILVNNAGFTDRSGTPTEHASMKRVRAIMALDVVAAFYCAQLAARQMLKQGKGSIINVSSMLGSFGSEFRAAAYHAAKGAVDNMTRVMAIEWAPRGVRVNAIAPAYFEGTEMIDAILQNPGTREHIEMRTPMGRLGRPEEVEGAVVYLASDASSYVTGCILYVDGGWRAGGGRGGPAPWERIAPPAEG
jgi:NAD(P)-dependent dehydrogenase (short-subunit alcohol dehydrogenase family)